MTVSRAAVLLLATSLLVNSCTEPAEPRDGPYFAEVWLNADKITSIRNATAYEWTEGSITYLEVEAESNGYSINLRGYRRPLDFTWMEVCRGTTPIFQNVINPRDKYYGTRHGVSLEFTFNASDTTIQGWFKMSGTLPQSADGSRFDGNMHLRHGRFDLPIRAARRKTYRCQPQALASPQPAP